MNILLESTCEWFSNISLNSIIIMIMMIFMIIGGIDYIRGGKWGYGCEFEKGICMAGPLVIAIASIIAVAPILANLIRPFTMLVNEFTGIDESFFSSLVLGMDMGAYSLAKELAENDAMCNFQGLVIGGIMGPTFSFTIPAALTMVSRENQGFIIKGVLIGLVTVPAGCIVGGLVMGLTGYDIRFGKIILNTVPVMIISLIVILGLLIFPKIITRIFNKFGAFVMVAVAVLLMIAIFQQVTGIMLPGFCSMSTKDSATGQSLFDSGMLISCQIGIVLAGAFPMMKWVTKKFDTQLNAAGNRIGLNDSSCAGIIAGSISYIPMVKLFDKMDQKGKIMNMAVTVGSQTLFGDQLGYVASVDQKMIVPVISGKLVCGILAVIFVQLLYRHQKTQ